MAATRTGGRAYATTADVQEAIEALALTNHHKLYRAAQACLVGSDFDDPFELIGEAVKRCMQAAVGQGGRPWPLDVPFEAFMIKVIEGLASDSRTSWYQRTHVEAEALAVEGQSVEDALAHHGHHAQSVESELLEDEERVRRDARNKADVALIVDHFKGNQAVSHLIEGKLAGFSASEIREIFEMSVTQYDSAHRAYRRGIEKLFSDKGRRQP